MKPFKIIAAFAAWLLSVGAGWTATLGLETENAPVLSASGFFLHVPNTITTFDGIGGTSTLPAAATGLDIAFIGSILPDATASPFALNVGPGISPVPFLAGLSEDFGFVFSDTGLDTFEFLIGAVTGVEAPAYGPQLLATIEGEFGTESSFFGGLLPLGPVNASLTIAPVRAPVPVPLPATGGILFGAALSLAALGRARRRRQS